jgi:8-oxo-dGTP pyrophosphatase MutT (NUDIX family)
LAANLYTQADFIGAVNCSDPSAQAWNFAELSDLLDHGQLRDAAVLIGMIERSNGWQVLLTKRTESMSNHAGQVAFPGGRIDQEDASVFAAGLRELEEEVGIAAHDVQIIGALDRFVTISNYTVTPILAIINPTAQASPQEAEVAEIFEAPLSLFADATQRQIETRMWKGRVRSTFVFDHHDKRIWGATASILVRLMQRIEQARNQ